MVAPAFGVRFQDGGVVCDEKDHYIVDKNVVRMRNFSNHPITEGTAGFWFRGTYLADLGGAIVLADTGPNSWFDLFAPEDWGDRKRQSDEKAGPFPVLAAMAYGKGRAVFASGADFLNNDWIRYLDARTLALNIFEWLASDWTSSKNQPPVARFTWEVFVQNEPSPASDTQSGQHARLDASMSVDPDGHVVSYMWDWDSDGAFDVTTADPVIEHVFTTGGPYRVTLRVEDDAGAFGQQTLTAEDAAVHWYLMGQEAYDTGSGSGRTDIDEAMAAYQRVVALAPGYLPGYAHLAHLLSIERRYEEAIKAWDRIIQSSKSTAWTAWALAKKAEVLRNACRLEEARVSVEEALRVDPQHGWYQLVLAGISALSGDYADAFSHLELARTLGSPKDEVDHLSAALHVWTGGYEDAEATLKGILERSPEHIGASLSLAWLFYLQGRFEEAEEMNRKGIEAAKQNSDLREAILHNNLGCILFRLGQMEEAIVKLETGLQLATDLRQPLQTLETYTMLGRAYLALGDVERAALSFQEAVAVGDEALRCGFFPRDALAYLGMSRWALGDEEGARPLLERALELSLGDAAQDVIARDVTRYLEGDRP